MKCTMPSTLRHILRISMTKRPFDWFHFDAAHNSATGPNSLWHTSSVFDFHSKWAVAVVNAFRAVVKLKRENCMRKYFMRFLCRSSIDKSRFNASTVCLQGVKSSRAHNIRPRIFILQSNLFDGARTNDTIKMNKSIDLYESRSAPKLPYSYDFFLQFDGHETLHEWHDEPNGCLCFD